MFKIATLAAIGAAVASATFLETVRNLDSTVSGSAGYNAACTFSSTAETCTTAGTCCAKITKMTAGVVSNFTAVATPFACVPAEVNKWSFDMGTGTIMMATCNFQNTATNVTASLNSTCSGWKNALSTASSWFGAATQYCDVTRSYAFMFNGTTYANATLDATYKQCVQQAGPWTNVDTYVYTPTNTLAGWNATETQKCSFGAYIKASAMMVVAVVAATLF